MKPGVDGPITGLAVLSACLLAAGCVLRQAGEKPSGKTVSSNIERGDYAGSVSCARCHGAIYDRFMQSPMRRMTRRIDSAHVHAPFDGRVFRFKDDRIVLEKRSGQRWMRIESPESGHREFRVTRIIGGHYREDFAGVESGIEGGSDWVATPDTANERVLPVSYMIGTGEFRYKGYSVMTPDRPGLKPGAVWNKTCIFCHNTVPYLSTVLGVLAGPDHPPFQGVTVDKWLPETRRWFYGITDSAKLEKALKAEIAYLDRTMPVNRGSVADLARQAVDATREKFREKHLVEVGIGCESCHGGSREHVENPRIKPSLVPISDFLKVRKPDMPMERDKAEDVIRACARCHQVLFSAYPWTWEGQKRAGPAPGGAHINSGEARDMLLGNCQVSCTACHDPHSHDSRPRLAGLEGIPGNQVCTGCHTEFRSPVSVRAHTFHDPAGPGSNCMSCHMPKKNMALDTRLTRYHRIGSPNEKARVEGDRPLECALCHVDKPVGELVDLMGKWWGRTYDQDAVKALYGGMDANVIEATLRLGKAHEKVVALYLAGAQKERRWTRLLARELTNPYPIVRYYADNALAQTLASPSPLDLHQDKDAIRLAALEWLKSSQPAPADSIRSNEE